MNNINASSKVLASAASGIVPLIIDNQGDADAIFGRTGIHFKDLDNPTNELDLGEFCRLFSEAANQTGNENFGLHLTADMSKLQELVQNAMTRARICFCY